ncbi:hypothetical protein NESM_000767600 [Novymonas esmeraldas]|uniref:Uncharacterized protein n=1 Tax=Novymonas esmeraldas TaxID=1808958 RepID=A0AAW0EXC3_9TRYP
MSGAGRKHRAKHLTQQYLTVSAWDGPSDGETLAVCLESPHGQHVRVLLLLAHPRTAPACPPAGDAPATELSGVGGSSSSGVGGAPDVTQTQPDGAAASLQEVEQLVHLPRKFHKVIWLSIKDIVVIADDAVRFKPSPEQLENFLRDPRNVGWRERIAAAQQRAEDQRVALQRMPQYGTATQTTTSVLTGPQVFSDARAATAAAAAGAAADGAAEGRGSDDDDGNADELVNPNWRSIKHQQQFFYGMDDDSDDDEDGDDESA